MQGYPARGPRRQPLVADLQSTVWPPDRRPPCDGLSQFAAAGRPYLSAPEGRRAARSEYHRTPPRVSGPPNTAPVSRLSRLPRRSGSAGHQWRVAVNHQPAVVAGVGQERLPDPQHVDASPARRAACRDRRRHGRKNGGRRRSSVGASASSRHARAEVRRRAHCRNFRASPRRLAQPQARRAGAVDRAERHRFMIALEQNRHDRRASRLQTQSRRE